MRKWLKVVIISIIMSLFLMIVYISIINSNNMKEKNKSISDLNDYVSGLENDIVVKNDLLIDSQEEKVRLETEIDILNEDIKNISLTELETTEPIDYMNLYATYHIDRLNEYSDTYLIKDEAEIYLLPLIDSKLNITNSFQLFAQVIMSCETDEGRWLLINLMTSIGMDVQDYAICYVKEDNLIEFEFEDLILEEVQVNGLRIGDSIDESVGAIKNNHIKYKNKDGNYYYFFNVDIEIPFDFNSTRNNSEAESVRVGFDSLSRSIISFDVGMQGIKLNGHDIINKDVNIVNSYFKNDFGIIDDEKKDMYMQEFLYNESVVIYDIGNGHLLILKVEENNKVDSYSVIRDYFEE